jgi:hypothetical protein
VEYKIFGAGRQPPDDFKEDLAAFCGLSDEQRNAIAEWFLSARSYDLYEPHLPPVIAASTLLPEQFRQTAGVIRNLLSDWQRRELELSDIERDLLLLGFDAQQITILLGALGQLSSVKERAWVDGRKGLEQVAGLPTIDDVNIVWNARPVFGGDASYYYDGDSNEGSYDRFLGIVYLATMEIQASDTNGTKQRIAIQMDEDMFDGLLRSMTRAYDQLQTFKRCTTTTIPEAGERKGAK